MLAGWKARRAILFLTPFVPSFSSFGRSLSWQFGGYLHRKGPMCVIFYLISRYMRPTGPWQRLRRYLSNGGGFYMTVILGCRPT